MERSPCILLGMGWGNASGDRVRVPRWGIRRGCVCLFLALDAGVLTGATPAVDPLALWPSSVGVVDAASLGGRREMLERAGRALPAGLGPALRFQSIYLGILAGARPEEWGPGLEGLVEGAGEDPVSAGVREVSRVWLARRAMAEIAPVLVAIYRERIRFPDTFEEVSPALPSGLRRDPWGDPWRYEPRAPSGMPRLLGQRYALAPARIPDLTPLDVAARARPGPPPGWRIGRRRVGDVERYEFRVAGAGAAAVISVVPGAEVGAYRFLHAGDGWVLMGGRDHLFASRY